MSKRISKSILAVSLVFWALEVCAQPITLVPSDTLPVVEIHQIDVGAGDASVIKVNTRNPPYVIVLDAGKRSNGCDVANYLEAPTGANLGVALYIDLTIVSHFDEDHAGGFVSSSINNQCGVLWQGDSKVTYSENDQVHPFPVYAMMDQGDNTPANLDKQFVANYKKVTKNRRLEVGQPNDTASIVRLPAPPSVKLPSALGAVPIPQNQLRLGGYIDLGMDKNNVPVRLRLIVANAHVLAPTKGNPYNYIDVGADIRRNGSKAMKADCNNWGLAWVLEYGQFRYFTGGDIAGYRTGQLFDIETTIAQKMPSILPSTGGPAGHVCVLKAGHHGSNHSSNGEFLSTLSPGLITISCGSMHGHPHQETLNRMVGITPPSDPRLLESEPDILLTELIEKRNLLQDRYAISGSKGYVQVPPAPPMTTVNLPLPPPPGNPVPPPLSNPKKRRFVPATVTASKKVKQQNTTLKAPPKVFSSLSVTKTTVDGDIKICVSPTNDSGVKISDISSFRYYVKDKTTNKWLAPVNVKCHRKQ